MAILEGEFKKLQTEEVEKKGRNSERVLQKIGTNINELIKRTKFDIGDILQSELTEIQFQGELDSTWKLCNGQNIENSLLATLTGETTAPDMRGRFFRQSNPENFGFDPLRQLNTTQNQSNKFHTHFNLTTNQSGAGGSIASATCSFGPPAAGSGFTEASNGQADTGTSGLVTLSATGLEARCKNISYNFFIKVDE